jgi:hypothetical protein
MTAPSAAFQLSLAATVPPPRGHHRHTWVGEGSRDPERSQRRTGRPHQHAFRARPLDCETRDRRAGRPAHQRAGGEVHEPRGGRPRLLPREAARELIVIKRKRAQRVAATAALDVIDRRRARRRTARRVRPGAGPRVPMMYP